MKILVVNGHLQIGGVEKSLVDLLNAIDYTCHQVDLLLFEGLGEYKDQIPKEVNVILCDLKQTYGSFISVLCKALKRKNFIIAYWKLVLTLCSKFGPHWLKLIRILRVTKTYDCAIAYRVGICADYVSFVASACKKYMWWHHGEFDYDDKTVNSWRKTVKKLDGIVCVSQATKELITPYFFKQAKNITVIPNMLLPEQIRRKSVMFHPYKKESNTILVSVGRMSPEKKMVNIVYAMEQLIEKGYSHIKWFIVGDGIEQGKIKRLIKEKRLETKVICVGKQENPYPYIADADLFVHPSYVESQGLAVLEAMALGVLCVVTKSLGVQEFIVDGENAILAEQSVESLVEKIIVALNLYSVPYEMKQNQQKTVEKYSKDCVVKKVMELLGE